MFFTSNCKYTNCFLLLLITTYIPHTIQFITFRLTESFESFDLYSRITPPEYTLFQLELDLTSPYLWVSSFPFKPQNGNIILSGSPLPILISHNATYLAQSYITSFYLTSYDFQTTYHFNSSVPLYHVISNTSIPFFDSFPLAHSIPNPHLNSPIYYLYNNKTITSKSFSIEFNLFTHNCKLHIGNINGYYLNKYKYNVKIKPVINKDYTNYWLIDFKEIYIESTYNNTVSVFPKQQNEIAYLQGNKDSIKVPKEFFIYLEKEVFKEYIEKKICFVIHQSQGQYLECDCSAIYSFPMFEFIISDYKVKLGYRDLFRRYNSETTNCAFLMKYYFNNKNAWMFGIPFLSTHIAVFNYDEDSITFYNDDYIYEKVTLPRNINQIIEYISKLITLLCIVGSIVLLSIKRIIK